MENLVKYGIYLLFVLPIFLMIAVTVFSVIVIISDTAVGE